MDVSWEYSLPLIVQLVHSTWSQAARIGRFQIQAGVSAPNPNGTATLISPNSIGFALFNLSLTGSNLKIKMNQWEKATGQNYTNPTIVLLDYIDQSTT